MNIEIARCKENIQNYGGLVVLDKFSAQLPTFNQNFLVENNNNPNRITDGQVLKAAHHLQCLGLTNYQDIEEMNSNTLFTNLIGRSVSCETYRQRLDELGKNPAVLQSIDAAIALQLRSAHLTTVPFMGQIFTPMDVDVTPLLNPKCHKEGISCTYKKVDGFAPLNSYLGSHALVFELRQGSQHSEKGAPEHLERCFDITKNAALDPTTILVRADSGHDDHKFLAVCEDKGASYIVKRNFRGASEIDTLSAYAKKNVEPTLTSDKQFNVYNFVVDTKPSQADSKCQACCVVQVKELLLDDKGEDPYALIRVTDPSDPNYGCENPKIYEVEGWWTNLPRPVEDAKLSEVSGKLQASPYALAVVDLYKDHATSEQYHSELKTDMNMELLPSKYMATNALFLAIAAIAFNTLRLIGVEALAIDQSFQHHKTKTISRIRLRTVIDKLINIACKVVKHARKMVVKFGKFCPRFNTLLKLCR